jgi:hypothetical protein
LSGQGHYQGLRHPAAQDVTFLDLNDLIRSPRSATFFDLFVTAVVKLQTNSKKEKENGKSKIYPQ